VTALIDLLQATLFTVLGEPISVIEVIGFVTGALCVWAVTRQYTWNWPVGIANNVAFLVLFLGVGLYADAVLQIVFAVVGVYGWILWGRRRSGVADHRQGLPVRRATGSERIWGVGLAVLLTAAAAFFLHATTDSTVPIPLYMSKGLWLTAILYTGFLALCIDGLRRWNKELRDNSAAAAMRPVAPSESVVEA
jgi:nicotinamide mononucleotide transporter